jgi:membrane protein insertase Oxa1/YidC/SpoIIIJ
VFPPLLVILQYVQMKMSFAQSARKKQQEAPKEPKKEGGSQAMQQKMMLYGLPLMIGVFAFQFPAAVSLYWGVSTIFAIGQQVVVNRKV